MSPRGGTGVQLELAPGCPGKDRLRPAGSTSPFCPQALDLASIRSHHWRIQGCSAVTGEDLLPGIDWLLDDISSRVFTAD